MSAVSLVSDGGRCDEWKNLVNERLNHGAENTATTDDRTVLHEVLVWRAALPERTAIFPGFDLGGAFGFVG